MFPLLPHATSSIPFPFLKINREEFFTRIIYNGSWFMVDYECDVALMLFMWRLTVFMTHTGRSSVFITVPPGV